MSRHKSPLAVAPTPSEEDAALDMAFGGLLDVGKRTDGTGCQANAELELGEDIGDAVERVVASGARPAPERALPPVTPAPAASCESPTLRMPIADLLPLLGYAERLALVKAMIRDACAQLLAAAEAL
jgi:hypothetical protein